MKRINGTLEYKSQGVVSHRIDTFLIADEVDADKAKDTKRIAELVESNNALAKIIDNAIDSHNIKLNFLETVTQAEIDELKADISRWISMANKDTSDYECPLSRKRRESEALLNKA